VLLTGAAYFAYDHFFGDRNPLRWKIGATYEYEFIYAGETVNSHLNPEGGSKDLSGKFDCTLRFSLTPVKKLPDGAFFSELAIVKIGACSFYFNGQDILENPEAREQIFMNRYAGIVHDGFGAVGDVRFRKNEDPIFVGTMKLIMAYFQTALPGKRKPPAEEWDQNGRYRVKYSFDGIGVGDTTVTKNIERYEELLAFPKQTKALDQRGSGSFRYQVKDALIAEIKGTQDQTCAREGKDIFSLKVDIKMTLIDVRRRGFDLDGALARLNEFRSSRLGTVELNDEIKKKMYEQQARNLTSTEMLDTLRAYGTTGEIGDKKLFMWRMTGYLKRYPERAADMVPLFNDPAFSSDGRMFIMGALASVGHPEAQTVMRQLLAGEPSKQDRLYPLLLQNISYLDTPDPATVSFAEQLYNNAIATNKLRSTASLILGAVAAKEIAKGNGMRGTSLNNKLVEELRKSTTPESAERMLDAIGNVASSSNIAVAAEYKDSLNDRVRASVANAVRFTQTPESEQLLLDMLDDKSNLVKMNAVNTLSIYSLKKEHFEKIHENIKSGSLNPDQYFYLAALFRKNLAGNEDIIGNSLREMQKRPMPPQAASQIAGLLEILPKK